jgi:sortase B
MRKKIAKRLASVAVTAVFFYSLFQLSGIFIDSYTNRNVMEEARQLYENAAAEAVAPDPDAVLSQDRNVGPNAVQAVAATRVRSPFFELLQTNPDVVGWIRIDDTHIHYPILQSADNEFYLNRNYKREKVRAGSIFMDFRNDIGANQPNTVLYGHRMKDGSMFGDLKKFLNKDFYSSHRTFSYDTLYKSYRAEVFSAYYTTTDFNYIQTEFDSDDEYWSFLQNIQERSLYKNDTVLTAKDRILTLSTCDYTLDPVKGRLAVHAKLVEEP